VAFSPYGNRLVTTWADCITRVWTLDLDEVVDIARDRVARGLTTAAPTVPAYRPDIALARWVATAATGLPRR
jgi:hypothetical protein